MRAAEEELLTRRQEMKNRCGDHSPVAQPDTESLRRGCSTPGGSRVRNLWRSHTAAWNHANCHSDRGGATGEPGRPGQVPHLRGAGKGAGKQSEAATGSYCHRRKGTSHAAVGKGGKTGQADVSQTNETSRKASKSGRAGARGGKAAVEDVAGMREQELLGQGVGAAHLIRPARTAGNVPSRATYE